MALFRKKRSLMDQIAESAAAGDADGVIAGLDSKNDVMARQTAATLLPEVSVSPGSTTAKRVTDALIGALDDAQSVVRGAAAQSLGQIGDERAVRPLVNRMNDPDLTVRKVVGAALALIADRKKLSNEPAVAPIGRCPNDKASAHDWYTARGGHEICALCGQRRGDSKQQTAQSQPSSTESTTTEPAAQIAPTLIRGVVSSSKPIDPTTMEPAMTDACSLCGTDLITDAQFEAIKPEPTDGPFATNMARFLELSKARDSVGVTCKECGAAFCVRCMQEHGKPHPSAGGLACIDCGGALTAYRPRVADRDGNQPPESREAKLPPTRINWRHGDQGDLKADAISPWLVRLPVLDQATGARKRAALVANPVRRAMFSGPREHTARFVSQMVELTTEDLQGIPELDRVDITLLIVEGEFQINYIQNWANGAVNAYGEEVIRTGEDVFEVFGGSKSADRMAAAWDQ